MSAIKLSASKGFKHNVFKFGDWSFISNTSSIYGLTLFLFIEVGISGVQLDISKLCSTEFIFVASSADKTKLTRVIDI